MLSTCTPSAIASSMAASMSASMHRLLPTETLGGLTQHALYMARRAIGAPPEATPLAYPPRAAVGTRRPAAVDAV
ncbi:hypothetical protein SLEP1_g37945 [Rubroshorea leprosula]|uniref:Uncharacterized protein n=1 Tax=Rubroshorea leprosula TaxID=152421 RepID=A0AAV5KWN2_9ROSI|nr:hypothetical protein SLEP1_g37945 [Rubroshorea leprosula]